MVKKLVWFGIVAGVSSQVVASGENSPLTRAQQAEANLYVRSAQITTENRQAAARLRECADESIFNSKKGRHTRRPALVPPSRKSLLTQTGIVVPDQALVAASLPELGHTDSSDKPAE